LVINFANATALVFTCIKIIKNFVKALIGRKAKEFSWAGPSLGNGPDEAHRRWQQYIQSSAELGNTRLNTIKDVTYFPNLYMLFCS